MSNRDLNSGEEVAPGIPGSGENICPHCHGSGEHDGVRCPVCGGSGRVIERIGGS